MMTRAKHILTGLFAAACVMIASIAQAQSFQVNLGDKILGTLSYSRSAKVEKLRSTLDNTPLGVFNGTFIASSKRVQTVSGAAAQKFESISKSSRKTRQIKVLISTGRTLETTVLPTSEETNLSDPTRVPAGVIDPVGVIGKLIKARGCPKKLTIYDGRRAIALTPNGSTRNGTQLTCAIKYQVIAGPGHLSPLYISKVKMSLQYDLTNDDQKLTRMKLGSGLFNLTLIRTD